MITSVVGVDIGTASIRAVEVTGVGKPRPQVLQVQEIALPDGAVRNGEVLEPNTVAEALKQLWSTGRIKSRNVVLGVGNSKVLVRDLSVPRLSQEEIVASLPSYVQDMLPVPVVDALLDFYPISQTETETGPMAHGLLIAAVKSAVLSNVTAVQSAGLMPVAVDLIPFALTRMASGTGNVAFVDVGARTTNVIVTSGGVPQFVRIIPTGGADLTTALATRLEISEEQAEALKLSLGLGTAGVAPELLPAIQIIREVTAELLNSLRNTLSYFSNTRQSEAYSQLVLSGGAAELGGFGEALGEISRIPVSRLDPFVAVALPKNALDLTAEARSRYTVALGLAMGGAA